MTSPYRNNQELIERVSTVAIKWIKLLPLPNKNFLDRLHSIRSSAWIAAMTNIYHGASLLLEKYGTHPSPRVNIVMDQVAHVLRCEQLFKQ